MTVCVLALQSPTGFQECSCNVSAGLHAMHILRSVNWIPGSVLERVDRIWGTILHCELDCNTVLQSLNRFAGTTLRNVDSVR